MKKNGIWIAVLALTVFLNVAHAEQYRISVYTSHDCLSYGYYNHDSLDIFEKMKNVLTGSGLRFAAVLKAVPIDQAGSRKTSEGKEDLKLITLLFNMKFKTVVPEMGDLHSLIAFGATIHPQNGSDQSAGFPFRLPLGQSGKSFRITQCVDDTSNWSFTIPTEKQGQVSESEMNLLLKGTGYKDFHWMQGVGNGEVLGQLWLASDGYLDPYPTKDQSLSAVNPEYIGKWVGLASDSADQKYAIFVDRRIYWLGIDAK